MSRVSSTDGGRESPDSLLAEVIAGYVRSVEEGHPLVAVLSATTVTLLLVVAIASRLAAMHERS